MIDHANRVEDALDIIFEYGCVDGAHHKQWVLDQVVRALTGTLVGTEAYHKWVQTWLKVNGYEWDKGIAP